MAAEESRSGDKEANVSELRNEDSASRAAVGTLSEDGPEEDEHNMRVGQEVQDAGELLASGARDAADVSGASWRAATEVITHVRPVPWLLWVIIRSVYGKSGEIGSPDPMTFSVVSNLIIKAASDKVLGMNAPEGEKVRTLNDATEVLGSDVAGTVCFMHAVCRRVSGALPDRVWRPLLDDALLRAHIGYHVGRISPLLSPGRGMLAGFAGRCGLAIQIASGDSEQAQRALTGLASGVEISEVCQKIYKCDPLQVSALALIAGGCNRDIALGISAYNLNQSELLPGSEQHTWLVGFSMVENLRMGRKDSLTESDWRMLGFDQEKREELMASVQQVQRHGHGWRWIVKPLSSLASKSAGGARKKPTKKIKRPAEEE